ncbi:MAG: hypothetical protein M1830_000481 [Pleopsidium flavum]|nr:MAG: hypothetical protein M1830_001765 [Pleopsidium flavum]KAI9873371.1 MAG: hypothetical protein M1830_000481 [Pleopsidium flavum]
MLNDVLSLCVGLWAVRVANQKTSSKMYTYGWQRAETLGALVNGVFLVALCLSIFLEAIQRFVEPQAVSNPKLVLIVGCFGLLSNILGLFLFHEHGHSHGGGGHEHSHYAEDTLSAAEEGHGAGHGVGDDEHTAEVADEGGNIADILPENAIGGWPRATRNRQSGSGELPSESPVAPSHGFSKSDEDDSTAADTTSPLSTTKPAGSGQYRRHRRRTSRSKSRGFTSVEDLHIHPASFRNDIIAASRLEDIESRPGTESEGEEAVEEEQEEPTEGSALLAHTRRSSSVKRGGVSGQSHKQQPENPHDSWHVGHNHNQPKEKGSAGGHSHGDLNMRGVFLHVMGDALGNIGVIGSALIIWLTSYSWRFYSDPAISLVITVIILGSAIPLCKAASRILLQAVPAGISIDEIKEDIEELPGILSCHHLHVWQLSDTKLVASLHVQIEFDFKGEGSARYMQLAKAVRTCLHEYGIHSSTIQPEFCLDGDHDHTTKGTSPRSGGGSGETSNGVPKSNRPNEQTSRAASVRSEADACLLECGDECGGGGSQCCAPTVAEAPSQGDHDHDHDHGHGH